MKLERETTEQGNTILSDAFDKVHFSKLLNKDHARLKKLKKRKRSYLFRSKCEKMDGDCKRNSNE